MPAVKRSLKGMPVTFLGQLRGAELAAAYAGFDLFVHTGTEETFGQTIQEAHASGLPVVAPRSGGPKDLVQHGKNGFLFEPDNDIDFRALIQLTVDDAGLRIRMGEAGRRSVLSRSWSATCEELLGYYRQVIGSRALAVTEKVS